MLIKPRIRFSASPSEDVEKDATDERRELEFRNAERLYKFTENLGKRRRGREGEDRKGRAKRLANREK